MQGKINPHCVTSLILNNQLFSIKKSAKDVQHHPVVFCEVRITLSRKGDMKVQYNYFVYSFGVTDIISKVLIYFKPYGLIVT